MFFPSGSFSLSLCFFVCQTNVGLIRTSRFDDGMHTPEFVLAVFWGYFRSLIRQPRLSLQCISKRDLPRREKHPQVNPLGSVFRVWQFSLSQILFFVSNRRRPNKNKPFRRWNARPGWQFLISFQVSDQAAQALVCKAFRSATCRGAKNTPK